MVAQLPSLFSWHTHTMLTHSWPKEGFFLSCRLVIRSHIWTEGERCGREHEWVAWIWATLHSLLMLSGPFHAWSWMCYLHHAVVCAGPTSPYDLLAWQGQYKLFWWLGHLVSYGQALSEHKIGAIFLKRYIILHNEWHTIKKPRALCCDYSTGACHKLQMVPFPTMTSPKP